MDVTVEIPAQVDWGGQMAYLIGWGSPFDADDHTYKVFGTDKGANYSGYSDPLVDKYLTAARQSDDPEVRRETYREALKSGSLHELIAMVRDIYTERTLRRAKGKQLSAYEDSALRNAQNALHSEFAYVMGIRPDEVPAFIEKELNKA